MGDPEAEVIIPRIQSDLIEIFQAVAKRNIENADVSIIPDSCVTIMLVSGGYPQSYDKGKIITNMENISDSLIFHAGTTLKSGEIITNGGRVLAISSMAANFRDALNNLEKKYYRSDIGFDL
jgi:phosphoribosylamine--glycine ligase